MTSDWHQILFGHGQGLIENTQILWSCKISYLCYLDLTSTYCSRPTFSHFFVADSIYWKILFRSFVLGIPVYSKQDLSEDKMWFLNAVLFFWAAVNVLYFPQCSHCHAFVKAIGSVSWEHFFFNCIHRWYLFLNADINLFDDQYFVILETNVTCFKNALTGMRSSYYLCYYIFDFIFQNIAATSRTVQACGWPDCAESLWRISCKM